MSDAIDWSIINNIVKPEHQYRDLKDPPLDNVRMAWPFKTEEELKILSKWFKSRERLEQKRAIKKHMETNGDALL